MNDESSDVCRSKEYIALGKLYDAERAKNTALKEREAFQFKRLNKLVEGIGNKDEQLKTIICLQAEVRLLKKALREMREDLREVRKLNTVSGDNLRKAEQELNESSGLCRSQAQQLRDLREVQSIRYQTARDAQQAFVDRENKKEARHLGIPASSVNRISAEIAALWAKEMDVYVRQVEDLTRRNLELMGELSQLKMKQGAKVCTPEYSQGELDPDEARRVCAQACNLVGEPVCSWTLRVSSGADAQVLGCLVDLIQKCGTHRDFGTTLVFSSVPEWVGQERFLDATVRDNALNTILVSEWDDPIVGLIEVLKCVLNSPKGVKLED